VTSRTGVRNVGSYMVRIGRTIICIDMTGGTCCRCSREPVCMTGAAKEVCVGPRERKTVVMIKGSSGTAGRVT
jgi:hypothetical protein